MMIISPFLALKDDFLIMIFLALKDDLKISIMIISPLLNLNGDLKTSQIKMMIISPFLALKDDLKGKAV